MIIDNIYRIGGNDEHGMNPPPAGKRTPVMPYIGRPFYENEFNRPTKYKFLAACARCGFRTFDIHPEVKDTLINARVAQINRLNLSALVTFAYNATVQEAWNNVGGVLTLYSALSPARTSSARLALDVSRAIGELGVLDNRGITEIDIGVLSSVYIPSILVEAGFMTNFYEAKLMLDPEWQNMVAESSALGVCRYFGVQYAPATLGGDYPDLQVGAYGRYVSLAQWKLAEFGYLTSLFDGVFGGLTEKAVLDFQYDNNLTPDGVIGRTTWRRLLTDFQTSPELSIGSHGIYVRQLQAKLLSKLYPTGTIDGSFGAQTEEAVRQFQSEHALPATGSVDSRTWIAVNVLDAGRPLP